MTSPAAAAAQDRPRRSLYSQLWFWVLIAIAAGIVCRFEREKQPELVVPRS